MKIAVIQGSTQIDKNETLVRITQKVVEPLGHEVVNFGVFEEETYSYTEVALMISLLLSSQAVDFVITGCSSGQGMALACNVLPNVLCGFIQNPQDAFLFGRINDGNAVSFSLGLGYGWLGDLNLEYSIEKLFDGEFGIGYPAEAAERKIKETKRVKLFNKVSKKSIVELLTALDKPFLTKVLSKKDLIDYIFENGQVQALNQALKQLQSGE
ncbi:RpiB/LacA/LacB family sugar-phosphate isomerase [uncultured Streptococcus sp.]|uniref:RpiB/LacA/LacB family sugar-phosphate isomerase n=1 Tax=uncultured Streptococcus sp. TaxID=83427 RepID=UPI0027DDB5CC|nr:RpiB/LacA/LacB family sugar-phosphate isomerase [uncultured Streptococcus sp.]